MAEKKERKRRKYKRDMPSDPVTLARGIFAEADKRLSDELAAKEAADDEPNRPPS